MPTMAMVGAIARVTALAAAAVALAASSAYAQRTVTVVQTAKDTGDRLTLKAPLTLSPGSPKPGTTVLTIDNTKTYQTMVGFGGAFTDSAAHVANLLNKTMYDQVMDMYYGPDGLNYNIGRIPMGSCDFSLWPNWSYDDMENDTSLSNFTIAKDKVQRIPMMQDAIARRAKAGVTMKFFGSPWSAPGWMKANGPGRQAMTCGARAIVTGCALRPEPIYHEAFANYFAKWVEDYTAEGIPIWGVTVMNEPQENLFTYEGQVFTPETERDFIKHYLGPVLRKAAPDVNIMILDHNKNHLPDWVPVILGDPDAAKYVWGTAVHWYTGDHFDLLEDAHNNFTSHHILATEATAALDAESAVRDGGTWSKAEHYAHDMSGDFNAWVTGFVDWNLMLDIKGGPLHVGPIVWDNFGSDSMMMVDTSSGTAYPQAFYYYVGQFSKYVPEGSVRIGWELTGQNTTLVETTSFVTPNGTTVVVAMNTADAAATFTLQDQGEVADVTIPAHGIATLQYPAAKKAQVGSMLRRNE